MLAFSLGPWETFWVLFYGFATYGNAGFLREQVCKYMCPYARFQSAMFDRDTLIITYDDERGEPRGARKRGTDPRAQGLGDCIDCTMVRAGLPHRHRHPQGPADRMHRLRRVHRRLRRRHGQDGFAARPDPLHHAARARSQAHAGAAAARAHLRRAAGRAGRRLRGGVALRSPVSLDVLRDRNSLYRLTDDGNVDNVYTLRILNKTEREQRFRIEAQGASALTLIAGGSRIPRGQWRRVFAAAARAARRLRSARARDHHADGALRRRSEQVHATTDARFLAPAR